MTVLVTDWIKRVKCVCVFFTTEVTYRCSRALDQEAVDLEILDIACKVNVGFCLEREAKMCHRSFVCTIKYDEV